MIFPKTATAAATLTFAGLAVFGTGTAALAQESTCYPTCEAGASDSTVTPGQAVTFNSGSGSFAPGSEVEVAVLNETFTRTAAVNGNVSLTYTVPESTPPGRYEVVFTGAGNTVRVPFSVVAAAAASPGRGQLPRTGSEDLVALGLAGGALVAAGASMVVVARRRRELPPGSLA